MAKNINIKQDFYDIESLNNIFSLCNFKYDDNILDVYILSDDRLDLGSIDDIFSESSLKLISDRIYEKNKNFTGKIMFYNLHNYADNVHLINDFGAKDNSNAFETLAAREPNFTMFVKDTDADFSPEKHPYLFGYNSFNYDTVMLALYINETFWIRNNRLSFRPPTAMQMRSHNDMLFSDAYKENMYQYLLKDNIGNSGSRNYDNREYAIRDNMLKSGRYIDVAALNESTRNIGLKRVLGMLGYQILESDKLNTKTATIYTLDELADLVAYNTSDVVNLHELFNNDTYLAKFELKLGLLQTYPELVYDKQPDSYAPNISPTTVRRDRLYADSTSAKLAARSLCPYGNLNDMETVSFMYPCESKAKELGIPQINVLDECRKFFHGLFPNSFALQKEFDRIYFYYKNNVEGHNFNNSDEYALYYRKLGHTPRSALNVSELPKINLSLPYYNKDGTPSRCYATFSVGGLHGAEYNLDLYNEDVAAYNELVELYNAVKTQYPDPTMLKQKDPVTKKAWHFEYKGKTYKPSDFLKTGSTALNAEYKDISGKRPSLFRPGSKGSWSLNKRYVYTSNADSNHEDFTSYYPNLLIMMQAFLNEGLGYDRYEEIFGNKQKYGKLMKDKSLPEEDRRHYRILREGTKLILNSASGAADVSYKTPIRMNNRIISMRIIGQLFTWRIGQAQTYEGASIISTNTDGLFSVFEPTKNAEILAREAANINVEIEPEFCHLVSKDSNNRIEIDENGKTITASGSSLSCYNGPNPAKSLAHAAIIDWAMSEYMRNVDNIHNNTDNFINEPFDRDKGFVILYNARFAFTDKAKYLNMFQTMLASSAGTQTYIYGETPNLQPYRQYFNFVPFNKQLFESACDSGDIKILSHYNRVFFVKPEFTAITGKPVYLLRNAASRVVTPAQKLTRNRNGEALIQNDLYALALLAKYNVSENEIPAGREAKITKVSGVSTDWLVYIENRSLFEMSEEEKQILIDNLDIDKYLTLLSDSFNKNWSNDRMAQKLKSSDEDDDEDSASGG